MKILKASLILLLGYLLFATQAMALVDYSDTSDAAPAPKKNNRIKINKRPGNTIRSSAPSRSSGSGASIGDFSIGTSYHSNGVEVGNKSGKVDSLHFNGHFQTNYGFYLTANHYMASSESSDLAVESGMQHGNPKFMVGFNWLRIGGGAEAATIDILAGASFGQNNSDFASTRTDKIFGVETTKKIASMVLGLGYEYRITGSPSTETELSIGNIQKLYAVLGWMATPDIRFSFEAGTYKLGLGDADYALEEKTSFGYASPQLHLALSPAVSLDLGAIFRTKRLGDDSLVDARLYDLKGAYGSSVLAGLSVSL